MGVINRFFLFLYALAGILLAVAIAAAAFQVLPEHYLQDVYTICMEQWEASAAALAILFLMGIHFLVYSLMGSSQHVHEEKEVILIVSKTEEKGEIMRSILKKAGPDTPAKAIAFSLPTSEVAGFGFFDS